MTQINLLPWREQLRQARKTRFTLVTMGFIGLTLIFVAILHLWINIAISEQEQRNQYLQSELDQAKAGLDVLKKKKQKQSTVDTQLRFIFSLRNRSYQVVRMLDELTRIIPDTISLTEITRTGNTVTILGRAQSNLQITLFMKNLDKSLIFKQPVLTEINTKENTSGDERSFRLTVEQED